MLAQDCLSPMGRNERLHRRNFGFRVSSEMIDGHNDRHAKLPDVFHMAA